MKSIYLKLVITFLSIFFLTGLVVNSLLFLSVSRGIINLPRHNGPASLFAMIRLSAMLSLAIGTLIIVAIGGRATKPITDLNNATKEIAKGNFDVQVDVKGKDEIGQLMYSFNIMAEELKGMEIMRNDFISIISHEFRTPLATIRGYADLLANEDLSQSGKRYLQIINDEAANLVTMSSNMLLLTRLENQVISAPKERYRLDEQIRKIILTMQVEWEKKDLEFELDDAKVYITANASMFFNVWQNLLGNAIKFADEGSCIHVKILNIDGKVNVKIQNFGEVISPDEYSFIFEKFYQRDSSRYQQGNGLGLSISKRIVDLYEGEIMVSSNEVDGTIFTVII